MNWNNIFTRGTFEEDLCSLSVCSYRLTVNVLKVLKWRSHPSLWRILFFLNNSFFSTCIPYNITLYFCHARKISSRTYILFHSVVSYELRTNPPAKLRTQCKLHKNRKRFSPTYLQSTKNWKFSVGHNFL